MYESKCDFTVGLRDGGERRERKRMTAKVTLSSKKKIKRHEIFNS